MGFIGETKDLVFGKLNMVSETVQEKVDFQEIKVQITDSYTKAIAKVEAVPDYVSFFTRYSFRTSQCNCS